MSQSINPLGHVGSRDLQRAYDRLRRANPAADADVVFQLRAPGGAPALRLKRSDLSATTQRELARLSKAADQFEATMTKQLLETMNRSLPKSAGQGGMGDLAQGFLNQAVAEAVSGNGRGMGLAEDLFKQLSRVVLSQAIRPTSPSTTPEVTGTQSHENS